MQTLKDYIESRCSGSQVDFAESQSITKQQVYKWLKHGGFYVVGGSLMQLKRKLKKGKKQ